MQLWLDTESFSPIGWNTIPGTPSKGWLRCQKHSRGSSSVQASPWSVVCESPVYKWLLGLLLNLSPVAHQKPFLASVFFLRLPARMCKSAFAHTHLPHRLSCWLWASASAPNSELFSIWCCSSALISATLLGVICTTSDNSSLLKGGSCTYESCTPMKVWQGTTHTKPPVWISSVFLAFRAWLRLPNYTFLGVNAKPIWS